MTLVLFSLILLASEIESKITTKDDSEFLAGTFLLTQAALNEAPFRYGAFLRNVLDRIEKKRPPSMEEDNGCSMQYEVYPTSQGTKLNIKDDTLRIRLGRNRTISFSAIISAEMFMRTWIKKGFRILFWCWRSKICNGQIVKYSATLDMKVVFRISWNKYSRNLSINLKPVRTTISNMLVRGCKPPWYIRIFTNWERSLNQNVKDALEGEAKKFERDLSLPTEFSPFEGLFVKYFITDLHWSGRSISFDARATMSYLINGKNVSFVPPTKISTLIPFDSWHSSSTNSANRKLLQGIRLSSKFLTSLMWYASITNSTNYEGSELIMDTKIKSTVSYAPPVVLVDENNLLDFRIKHGLVMASCLPIHKEQINTTTPSILLKAEFFNLAGSGRIHLTTSKGGLRRGIRVSLDTLDISNLITKPIEPKLPLPESFENALMKTAIFKLQPIINQYLYLKPFYLPDNINPIVAEPEIYIRNTGFGNGYSEILSFCLCNVSSGQSFNGSSLCSSASHVCEQDSEAEMEYDTIEDEDNSSTKLVNQNEINLFKKIGHIRGEVADSFIDFINRSANHFAISNIHQNPVKVQLNKKAPVKFSAIFNDSSNVGVFLSVFSDSHNCSIPPVGDAVSIYWLWILGNKCASIYIFGEFTYQHYLFNKSHLMFNCDEKCVECEMKSSLLNYESNFSACRRSSNSLSSFRLDFNFPPHVPLFDARDFTQLSVIANVYFANIKCSQKERYVHPQLISSHTNMGSYQEILSTIPQSVSHCTTEKGSSSTSYSRLQMSARNGMIDIAVWDCSRWCKNCSFNVQDKRFNQCYPYHDGFTRFSFSNSVINIQETFVERLQFVVAYPVWVSTVISGALSFTFLLVVFVKYRSKARIIRRNSEFSSSVMPHTCFLLLDNVVLWFRGNMGFRFLFPNNNLLEDIFQNMLLLINASLAIVFAFKWTGKNGPLMLFNSKLDYFEDNNTTMTLHQILPTEKINDFAESIKFWTCSINITNGVIALCLVCSWIFTISGRRSFWIKARLASSFSCLTTIFILIAILLFSAYIDNLIVINRSEGFFLTKYDSLYKMANNVVKVSLHGVSLSVISFTIIFLLYSINAGLFIGTLFFALIHPNTKRECLNVLIKIMVAGSVVQPLICLHPVIIWAQESENGTKFLLLIILVWCLPFVIHTAAELIIRKVVYNLLCFFCQRSATFNIVVNTLVLMLQIAIYSFVFPFMTIFILKIEIIKSRTNLYDFVFFAVVAVFVWMFSAAYILLSLVLHDDEPPDDTNCSRKFRSAQYFAMKTRLLNQTVINSGSPLVSTRGKKESNEDKVALALNSLHKNRLKQKRNFDKKRCSICHWFYVAFNFILELREYKNPTIHGWRIKFRRLFLTFGVVLFTYQSIQSFKATLHFSSKEEIQNFLDYTNTNLTWPDSGSVLDDVFILYNYMKECQSYIMLTSTFLFWIGLMTDYASFFVRKSSFKALMFNSSRLYNFLASLTVFASVIIISLPDYLEASNIDKLCPFCGKRFNAAVYNVAEFCMGLFFACIFTIQLIPILITIVPALVRASVLMLIHPVLRLDVDDASSVGNLRLIILRKVVQFASLLTFPITFMSMYIVNQYQKDICVTIIILAFWICPACVLFIGQHLANKYHRPSLLLYIYYLYNVTYISLLGSLFVYSMRLEKVLELLSDIVTQPSFWTNSLSQIFLCNVVISDMLYTTVF